MHPGYSKTSMVTWCLLSLSGTMTVATYALQIGGVPSQQWRGRCGNSSSLAFEVSFSQEVSSVTYFDVDDVNGDILDAPCIDPT